MINFGALMAFGLVSLGMVCTPGPNMIYLISRTITQGRMAGIISLCGVALGFIIYISATLLGLSVIFIAVPTVFTAVKVAGALYLLWLAWKAIKPGSATAFAPLHLQVERPCKLFFMGLMTNLLNPKAAVLYISLLPQFENPAHGSLLAQGVALGVVQITISMTVNLLIILTASKIASWFGTRPLWLKVQRFLMASVLTGLSIRLAVEQR